MAQFKNLLLLVLLITVILFVLIWVFSHEKPSPIVADFGNRKGGAQVPAMFFGAGGTGTTLSDSDGMGLITKINLLGNRIFVQVDSIYNGSTPNWSTVDAQVKRATANGLSPVIVIQGTPASLGASSCSMPSNPGTWGQLAASVVAHIETLAPNGIYEVWNEPDSQASFCSSNALQDYLRIYAAAAPQMKAAAPGGMVGGPALASPGPNAATWIPAFLSGATAPYVDFFSFHLYITGTPNLPHMTWQDLINASQSSTNGLSYHYRTVERLVRAGQQPNAKTTPIFLTEYNANYAFQTNCCQNDVVYGPLWNETAIVDFLNAANDGASTLPARLVYFNVTNSAGYFCLIGVEVDSADKVLNCQGPKSGEPYVPYPSYLAFKLWTGAGLLNLEQSGARVVGRPGGVPGDVLAAAFYSPTADNVILVNPSDRAYAGVPVKFTHAGFRAAAGSVYVLSNSGLTKSPVSIISDSFTSQSALVNIPAYSTVVVSLSEL